jgi:Fe-S-cluster containining protein
MEMLYVLAVVSAVAGAFSLGWLSVFVSRVRLAKKKGRFKCMMCGNCCRLRFIHLTKDDIARIQSKGHSDFHDNVGGECMLKRIRGRCMFVGKDDSCSIYEIRPEVCRKFPFFRMFGLNYCRAVSYCPGVEAMKDAV